MSAAAFAALVGVKYSTLASWDPATAQERRGGDLLSLPPDALLAIALAGRAAHVLRRRAA
jgi:hypothetical protein